VARFNNSKTLRRCKIVWTPPSERWIKLNFDGSAIARRITVGGVLHDNKGRLEVAYAGSCGMESNNEAEALALLWGMRIAKDRGTDRLEIEGDSLLIINVVKGIGNGN
jgi:ribonuclease HI